jgi:DNA-binding XRE family transcriptional regulator
MNAIHLLAETADTVTLARADYEKLLEIAEDAEDIRTLNAAVAREERLGKEEARADNLPAALVVRLIGGEHPVRIWREHRRLTPQALAQKAGLGRSYIAEIEGGKKPGSIAAFRKLADALGVAIDDLA